MGTIARDVIHHMVQKNLSHLMKQIRKMSGQGHTSYTILPSDLIVPFFTNLDVRYKIMDTMIPPLKKNGFKTMTFGRSLRIEW
jgi:hypothetical protein